MSPAKPNEPAMAPKTLKGIIDGLNLSNSAAAKKLGVSRQTIHRWLTGVTPISRANAAMIRETFLRN